MTEQTLALGLVPGSAPIVNPYWLHMEIKEDPLQDGMTVAEAAKVIDAIYNIKPCEPAETQQSEIWQQSDEGTNDDVWTSGGAETLDDAKTLAAQRRFVDAISPFTTRCGADSLSELIGYDVTIKIFRSHRDELYKLQAANALLEQPIKFEGRVKHTVEIDNQNSHTFNNPIIRRPVLSWQGFSGPKIHIIGNTAYWDGLVKGTLRAEFDTEWDEVTIHVTGEYSDSEMITGTDMSTYGTGFYLGSESGEEIDDYQDIECSLLAFYHLQYEEIILNRPEDDESTTDTDKLNICRFTTSIDDSPDEFGAADPDAKCMQHVNETIICHCDGKKESNSYYEPASCPPGVSDRSTLQGSIEREIYKDCGYQDEVNDPAYYKAKCCEDWPFYPKDMPRCKRVVFPFGLGQDRKEFDESTYPEGTQFVIVAPADGKCGEWVIEQIVNAKNCCEGVPPIWWDGDSASIIAPSDEGTIIIGGGDGRPLTVKVRGNGFYLDEARTIRDAVVDTPFSIFTGDGACGSAAVYVTDGCSNTGGTVMCTNGVWVGDCYAYDHYIDDVISESPGGIVGLNLCADIYFPGGSSTNSCIAWFVVSKWFPGTAEWGSVDVLNPGRYDRVSMEAMIAATSGYQQEPNESTNPPDGSSCGETCKWICE